MAMRFQALAEHGRQRRLCGSDFSQERDNGINDLIQLGFTADVFSENMVFWVFFDKPRRAARSRRVE
jgi:hypothetical protein